MILGLVNAFARPTLEGFFSPVTAVSYALSMFLINSVLIWVAGTMLYIHSFVIIHWLTR